MFASYYYVFFLGIFLPAVCVRSYYRLKAGAPFPKKPLVHKQTIIMHGLMLFLAYFTWRSIGIGAFLFPRPAIGWKDGAAGLGTLVVFVAVMYPQWKSKSIEKRERTYRLMPTSSSEMGWWCSVSLSAGIIEEIVYRGVLFSILYYWLDNWWAATLLCAASFALGHAIQGLRSTLIIFCMSIVFQGLVRFTGSLYVAMAVHAIYDMIAGLAYLSFYKRFSGEAAPPATASLM